MTLFWCIVWMTALTIACIAFYRDGYRNGKSDGYKLAQVYEDGYKREWRA